MFSVVRGIRSLIFLEICTLYVGAQLPQTPAKRKSFTLPFLSLKSSVYQESGRFRKVKIILDEHKEYVEITPRNDFLFKSSRNEIHRTTYAEYPEHAHLLSNFELEQILCVVNSFTATLEIFERDLERQHWDRCLYLDSFFPRFLQSFYHLCNAAWQSFDALPAVADIPDSWFDISLHSIKSDRRIYQWQTRPDHIVKLRIITRELIFHLKKWEKKSTETVRLGFHEELREAYGLFIKLYFALPESGG